MSAATAPLPTSSPMTSTRRKGSAIIATSDTAMYQVNARAS
jgi:hypothetical protein